MDHLFRDLSLGHSKREITPMAKSITITTTATLPSPFNDLTTTLSTSDLRLTAYEIFVTACRTSTGKPLSYIPVSAKSSPTTSTSPSFQRSLTSTAASKVKKALGLRSPGSGQKKSPSNYSGSPGSKGKRAVTVGELMRTQMRVSDSTDSRVRRGLLRITAGQVCSNYGWKAH